MTEMSLDQRPTYPADDIAAQERYFHHLEWGAANGYQYTSTRAKTGEPETLDGWEPNVDRWPLYAEEEAGWTRVKPGILRSPSGDLVAYWRRKR